MAEVMETMAMFAGLFHQIRAHQLPYPGFARDLDELIRILNSVDVIPEGVVDDLPLIEFFMPLLHESHIDVLPYTLKILSMLVSRSQRLLGAFLSADPAALLIPLFDLDGLPLQFRGLILSLCNDIVELEGAMVYSVESNFFDIVFAPHPMTLTQDEVLIPQQLRILETFSYQHDEQIVAPTVPGILEWILALWNEPSTSFTYASCVAQVLLALSVKGFTDQIAEGFPIQPFFARFWVPCLRNSMSDISRLARQLIRVSPALADEIPIDAIFRLLKENHPIEEMHYDLLKVLVEISKTGRLFTILEIGAKVLLDLTLEEGQWRLRNLIMRICWEGFVQVATTQEAIDVMNSKMFAVMAAGCEAEELLPKIFEILTTVHQTAFDELEDTAVGNAMDFLGELAQRDDEEMADAADGLFNLYANDA
jgi:hypothetical protein